MVFPTFDILLEYLDVFFNLKERNTTVLVEIRAAFATFLTMCYILLVNPQLLSKLGIDPTHVVVGTALSSAVGSIIAGLFGNLPIGLAPGVGLSAYLVYGLVLGEGLSLKEAFTTCFVASLILLLFSISGISQIIMKVIPRSVKMATIVGMGMQIALVGMTSVHLVTSNAQTIVGLGDLTNYQIWLSIAGLVLIGSLLFHEVSGAILLGIMSLTLLTWIIENSFPDAVVQMPDISIHPFDFIDLSSYDPRKCLSGIVAFIFIGIIDVSGVIFGMASMAGIKGQDENHVPGDRASFVAVSLASLVSSLTGGTPVIVYVESAAGIKEGGRSGLTAVTIGMLFLLSLFVAPLLAAIPLAATSPVAILIGAMMMSMAKEIDWNNMSEAIPAFLTASIMPFTFSISNGIVFGLISALGFYITTGQFLSDLKGSFSPSGSKLEMESLNPLGFDTPNDFEGSILDNSPFIRTPSLILKRKQPEISFTEIQGRSKSKMQYV